MIGMPSGFNAEFLIIIYLVLFVFSIFYNWLVAWLEREGHINGFVSLFIVGGVLVTLGGMALLNPFFALITLGGFVCSGTAMIIGSIQRYMQKRKRIQLEQLRQAQLIRQSIEDSNDAEAKVAA